MKKTSFSQQMKDELIALEFNSEVEAGMWLCSALAAAGTFRGTEVSIKSAQKNLIRKISDVSASLFGFSGKIIEKKAHASWLVSGREESDIIRESMERRLGYDSIRGTMHLSAAEFSKNMQLSALRAFMLTAGSLAEPEKSYQIEFSFRRQSVLEFLEEILSAFDIESFSRSQGAYHMLYIKNGDDIASVLGIMGAHISYLNFEEIRVRKNMNERVNRAVNCDSANTQRVADTSARQLDLLRRLEEAGGFHKLPEDLAEAARLRRTYEGASIRELGSYMDPPLGKSGMYHRLGRLEKWAENYLEKQAAEETSEEKSRKQNVSAE